MGKIIYLKLLSFAGRVLQFYRRRKWRLLGLRIGEGVIFERNLNLDRVYPSAISIGSNTLIASGVTILSHEHIYRDEKNPFLPKMAPVSIGSNCFIGVGAMILPGVSIGDQCVVGAGSIVTKDIPSNSMAVGVPARVIRKVQLNSKTHVKKIV